MTHACAPSGAQVGRRRDDGRLPTRDRLCAVTAQVPSDQIGLVRRSLIVVFRSASIPSPSFNGLHLGPFTIHVYGVMYIIAVAAAVLIARRRWRAQGSDELVYEVALWGFPAGLIGGRLYFLVTSWDQAPHTWWGPFAVWDGGLGIWGGIFAGTLVGLWVLRRRGADIPRFLDAAAPALLVAQSIGRIREFYPSAEQSNVSYLLARNLIAIIAQRLLPYTSGTRTPCLEILRRDAGVQEAIQTNNLQLLSGIIEGSVNQGMHTFDQYLTELLAAGMVTEETARHYAVNKHRLDMVLRGIVTQNPILQRAS